MDAAILDVPARHTNCVMCGRALRSPISQARGYGATCGAKLRRIVSNLTAYKPAQLDSAYELIEDEAIIHLHTVVFLAVSSDGTDVYTTSPTKCTCPAGENARLCYHTAAARMTLAA